MPCAQQKCTAVLMQIGIWGTCWFTATLGVHSFVSFVFYVPQARWRSLTVIAVGWAIAFVAGEQVCAN